mgnify:CR=1 FL=1
MKTVIAALMLLAGTATGFAQSAPADAVKDLAPTGKLRAAINLSNIVLAQHGPSGGDPVGVTPDLARELGKRLNVPVELIKFDAAGKVFEAAKSGQWDVAFLAIEPVRAAEIAFTAPYIIIQGIYLVPKDSPRKTLADMDRDGVRIGVNKGSAYDLFLTRTLKNAKLVREVSGPDTFIAQKLEAAAGVEDDLPQPARRARPSSGRRATRRNFMWVFDKRDPPSRPKATAKAAGGRGLVNPPKYLTRPGAGHTVAVLSFPF